MQIPRLRAIRESRTLTQRELAEKAGITHATISRIENGQSARVSTVRKLVEALDCESSALTTADPGL